MDDDLKDLAAFLAVGLIPIGFEIDIPKPKPSPSFLQNRSKKPVSGCRGLDEQGFWPFLQKGLLAFHEFRLNR